jgi:hypothetical protein
VTCLPTSRPVLTELSVSLVPTPDTRVPDRSVCGMPPRLSRLRNKLAKRELVFEGFALCVSETWATSVRGSDERLGRVWRKDTLGPAQEIYCMITGFALSLLGQWMHYAHMVSLS